MTLKRAAFGLGIAVPVIVLATFLTGAIWGPPKGPTQPIAYSHKIHAGDYKIACQYCHYTAEHSSWIDVPPVEVCMGCHKITALDKPEVQKIHKYWNDKEPIRWVRVHFLPQHAKFNHKRHVKAGFSCQTCHGPIETMDVVYQYSSLSMNWCINCHDGQNELGKKASVDCLTCHY